MMMNRLAKIERIQHIIDMVTDQSKKKGMNALILDLPPELLEKVFDLMDFQCKRNCRLVHDYWRAVIDHHFMKFKIDTWDKARSVHAIETLAASQQYFEKVTISFLWGKPCPDLPASSQRDHSFPKIRKVVFGGCGPTVDFLKYTTEACEIREQGNLTKSHKFRELLKSSFPRFFGSSKSLTPSLHQLRELLMFLFQRVCGRAEYLRINLRHLLTFIVPEMKSTLSNVTWNSMRKIKLYTGTRENLCLFGVLKIVKIPILSEFEIDILPSMVSADSIDYEEEERNELTAFFVDICHFLLRHKETLRTVKCNIQIWMSGQHPGFAEETAFIHGQLKLEHCKVRMAEQKGMIDSGFLAVAFTEGSSSLRSFELVKEYEYDDVHEYNNRKLQKDLEKVLRKNGPTLEYLSLRYMKINLDLLKYCTKLKTLELGLTEEQLEVNSTLQLDSVRELTFGSSSRLTEAHANWVVQQMPNLRVITLVRCKFGKDELKILMKLKFLHEVKIQRTIADKELERHCNDSLGMTYKMTDRQSKSDFYLVDYSASIFIDRLN